MSEAKRCERCGARKPRPIASPMELLDYCAKCSRDLCDDCMEKGCCGNVPAKSGMDSDSDLDDAILARVRNDK